MSTQQKPRSAKKPAAQPVETEYSGVVTDALRQAMKDSGLSAYRLAADSGVNIAGVLRFMNGERSMNLFSVDRLAALLDLELVPRKKKSGG